MKISCFFSFHTADFGGTYILFHDIGVCFQVFFRRCVKITEGDGVTVREALQIVVFCPADQFADTGKILCLVEFFDHSGAEFIVDAAVH